MGSMRGQCRVHVMSMWDRCWVDVGSKELDVFVDGKMYRINEEVEEGNKKTLRRENNKKMWWRELKN